MPFRVGITSLKRCMIRIVSVVDRPQLLAIVDDDSRITYFSLILT
jgi:hypothetical protein